MPLYWPSEMIRSNTEKNLISIVENATANSMMNIKDALINLDLNIDNNNKIESEENEKDNKNKKIVENISDNMIKNEVSSTNSDNVSAEEAEHILDGWEDETPLDEKNKRQPTDILYDFII